MKSDSAVAGKGPHRDSARERFWRDVFLRFDAGGLGVRAFCAAHGLADTAFYHWRREIARRDADAPARVKRLAAGPNPLRDHTTVNFDLPAGGHVTLEVFDAAGRIVSVLADGWRAAGRHLEAWRPERSVPGGVYFARLTVREPAGGATQRRTVRLVRLR